MTPDEHPRANAPRANALRAHAPRANALRAHFFLARLPATGPDGFALQDLLLNRNMMIRTADSIPGLSRRHIRISPRTPEENSMLFAAISEILKTTAAA